MRVLLNKVGDSQAARDKVPDSDFAGPNRTYPITTQQDVDDAARLIGHASNPSEVKRRIIEIAHRKGFSIPDSWKEDSDNKARKSMTGTDVFKQFYQISKIDEEKQMVYGVASGPDVDTQDEIVPPELMQSAMPEYMQRGNLREMHAHIAAGKVKAWKMNENGETEIAAKVVDPTSWLKVKEGVLTGFSIGGNGTTKIEMMNGKPVKVYTSLSLSEISLVDSPAYPKANITLWKADGLPKKGNSMIDNQITELESAGAGLDKLAKAATAKRKQTAKALPKATAKSAPRKTRKADDTEGASDGTEDLGETAPPDPKAVMQQLLGLHNAMVMAGNMDGASGITDAITCLQAALSDEAGDEQGDLDDDGDSSDLQLDDSDMEMADGDPDIEQEGNPDDVDDGQEDDANTGPNFSLKGQGADDTDSVPGDGSDSEKPDGGEDATDKRKAAKGKKSNTSKALALRPGSYRSVLAKASAYDPERETHFSKAVAANFSKVAAVLEGFAERLEKLESQPRPGGPAVRAVSKGLIGGAEYEGMTEIQAFEKAIATTQDPFAKARLREELAIAQTRTAYNFTNR